VHRKRFAHSVREHGRDIHLRFTGNPAGSVSGAVFRTTAQEPERADEYEVASYRRDGVTLTSGECTNVYVDANSNSDSSRSYSGTHIESMSHR
jgi:hypothetical protein